MKKLLIVEDDPIVAQIYKTRLGREGFDVETATDGQTGFRLIQENAPDAVLLDLMLPRMNGMEILKEIRGQPRFGKLPIIVFTSAYVPTMIDEAFLAGATLVFNKATVTPRQMIDALQKTMVFSPAFPEASPDKSNASSASKTCPRVSPDEEAARSAQQATIVVVDFQQRLEANDSELQAELRKEFVKGSPEVLMTLRRLTKELSRAQEDGSRQSALLELYRKVHALTGGAGLSGVRSISRMAAAVEILLRELSEKPQNLNTSTMRTIAHSMDLMADLFATGTESDLIDQTDFNILVVDDDIVTRRAITYGLEKAGLNSVSAEDAQNALRLAAHTRFDLMFLDVLMPGMDGFELCREIRALPGNQNAPVIFVTSLTDFPSRAKASLSGGMDLIAKPFMFIEPSVKALLFLLRSALLRPAKAC